MAAKTKKIPPQLKKQADAAKAGKAARTKNGRFK
jgi:hypothetical protein